MEIYNTNNLRRNLINKGISIDNEDIDLFNQSDYYQVINAHKMLFITDVEDIDKIMDNIDKNKDIARYGKAFSVSSNDKNFKENVLKFLCTKYGINLNNINDQINELKRIKYIHHIYDSKSNFNDFYRIYEFEHDFRILLLKYVLKIENCLKHTFIRTLNDFGGLKDNFLTDIGNYNTSMENYSNSIKTLKEILSLYDSTKSKAITRKVEQNISIPYWILINEMSFGKVLRCIKNLKPEFSNKIYKNLVETFTQVSSIKFKKLNSKNISVFEFILDYIGGFRNLLAHNQPIFSYNIKDNSLANLNNLNYSLPYPSDNAIKTKMSKLNTNDFNLAINKCQHDLNNQMKVAFQVFFSKDSFNKNLNYSNFNLSFMVYLICKINGIMDSKCLFKDELINLFYDYNIFNINDKYINSNDKTTIIKRKYQKHFNYDLNYTKFSGINLKFLNEL